MRLHELEATAFGPFGGTVRVDFDALSDGGLFLLTGATGAGKTSVLDAVCFALYGEVPGDRQVAKRLRSDHAAPGVRPEVRLELTVAGRRFRVVRSPAWERPKKRGQGTTTDQASVTLAERRGGTWLLLSTRLDETGHLVSALLGMNLAQFCQVALLPQGRFQAFLRARSEERHKLLEQLFRTRRFADVERWLRDHRTALRRRSDDAQRGVADLVSRVSECTEEPLPEAWDVRDLTTPADDGTLAAWAARRARESATEATGAETAAATALAREQSARLALDRGRAELERRGRVDAALREQFALLVEAPGHLADHAVLEAARRAAGLEPVHGEAEAAHERAERAAGEARAAGRRAAALLVVPEGEGLERAVAAASAAADAVRAALPHEAQLHRVRAQVADHEARLDDLATRSAETARAHEALPALLARVHEALATADAAATRLTAQSAVVDDVSTRLAAAREVPALTAALAAARAELTAAAVESQVLREHWLDLREARIDGMAAEIAGALAVGACCPVCGSADHPHMAQARLGAPTSADESAALKALDDAKAAEHAHDARVRDLAGSLAVLRDRSGALPVDDLEAQLLAATAELDRLAALADEGERIRDQVTEAEARRRHLVAAMTDQRVQRAELAAGLRGLRQHESALAVVVDAALGDTGAPDLATLLEHHLARVSAGHEALRAERDAGTAADELDLARRAWALAAAEAGFADVGAAAAAQRGPAEVEALARRTSEHERRSAAVSAVVDEGDVEELLAAPRPDVEALASAHERALESVADAGARAAVWSGRAQRLADLVSELDAALAGWAPLREELAVATGMASFAEGKAGDNRLQMRLSAYVLAHRLSQVVAAANERLAGMSDQRYRLEHTGQRGAGETRGGLSLLVRDDWTGEARDPATLSGGETFVVSLALALGLADVVTHEAGGTELDTLFVDEGFGALDAETLDDVLDTLDTLRDGGRVVGVVSHVPDMRDRIPTQLHVGKRRDGSTVRLVRAG